MLEMEQLTYKQITPFMKISERNLFVRTYTEFNGSEPTNLCALFWFSVYAFTIIPLLALAVLAAAVVLLIGLVLLILNFEWALFLLFLKGVLKLLMFVVIIAVAIGAVGGVIYLIGRVIPERVYTTVSSGSERVADVVAVIKNKYCPRLVIVRTKELSLQ